jgi:hypothetical protein
MNNRCADGSDRLESVIAYHKDTSLPEDVALLTPSGKVSICRKNKTDRINQLPKIATTSLR